MAATARVVGNLQAGKPGHLDVEKQDIRRVGIERTQRGDAVLGFGGDPKLGPQRRELLAQLLAQDFLVFGDDRPRAWVSSGYREHAASR